MPERYDMNIDMGNPLGSYMEPNKWGNYVKIEDYEELESELNDLKKKIESARRELE